jgi:hypothetical protein
MEKLLLILVLVVLIQLIMILVSLKAAPVPICGSQTVLTFRYRDSSRSVRGTQKFRISPLEYKRNRRLKDTLCIRTLDNCSLQTIVKYTENSECLCTDNGSELIL